MALDPIKLDELTWSEMVVAIRRRVAAASGGKWTLHAPVDPGITLLELFAWLLEQRVYWMDQIPDSLVRGALRLLGEEPKPTQAATTVMRFPAPDSAEVLPAMTELSLFRSNPPLVFSTESEIALLPFEKLDAQHDKLGLSINSKDGDKDRTTDFEQGKVIRIFPADGAAAEVKITLWLRQRLPASVAGKRFSLFFDLRDLPGIAPQWSPEARAAVKPPAEISWFYGGAGGKQIQFTDKEIDDGTGGLRRSGLALLPIKADWQPESEDAAQSRYLYALWMRVERASFTAPPRLERLIPNVAIASHRRKTREHALRREWLPLPGNVVALADLPEKEALKDHPPIENTVELQIKERDGNFRPWRLTSDLAFHGPEDRVFVVDRAHGELRFGDGLTGRLPVLSPNGGDQLKVQYSVGGGAAGKLGANLKWESGDFRAVNVVQTEGGDEAETMAAAHERAASTLKQRTRAVTREDYEEIARTTPGVAIKRAHAAVGFHPAHPCAPVPGAVTVFIVPAAPRPDVLDEDSEEFDGAVVESAFVAAPVPDAGALAAVRARLNEMRLVASEVFVSAPRYRPAAITIDVESNAADRAELSRKIKLRLRTFLDPLIGGDKGEGWPFGEPLRPSAILREAQRSLGDQGSVVQVFIEMPDAPPPNIRIDGVRDPIKGDCAMWRRVEQEDAGNCAATALGAYDEAEFRRRCSEVILQNDQQGPEPACADVAVGANDLIGLRQLAVNFHRPSDSQGGLR